MLFHGRPRSDPGSPLHTSPQQREKLVWQYYCKGGTQYCSRVSPYYTLLQQCGKACLTVLLQRAPSVVPQTLHLLHTATATRKRNHANAVTKGPSLVIQTQDSRLAYLPSNGEKLVWQCCSVGRPAQILSTSHNTTTTGKSLPGYAVP